MDQQVTPRRIGLALRSLPPGAWPDAEHPGAWTVTEYLLATLIDEVRQLTWVVVQFASGKKAKRPEPMFRPGDRQRPARPGKGRGWAELARLLHKGGDS